MYSQPICCNPFINCIFNNPNHNKSPFKNIIQELKDNNQFTLLIPPAYILYQLQDKQNVKREIYNEDFLKSHILRSSHPVSSTFTVSKEQSVIYNTLNNKQVLLKNRMVYTGKGFKTSLKLRIASIQYFNSFCDYFPKGSKFMLIYIENSLIGTEQNLSLHDVTPTTGEVTFEKLLRSFPLLSKAVSDQFLRLFHHNNYQFRNLRYNTRKKLAHIKIEFQKVLEEAFKIISDSVKIENPNSEQTYNLINNILSQYPGIDLNKLVHEYVEINLYDVLWAQLIFQFNSPNDDYDQEARRVLTKDKYEKLACLSLSQLDIPIDKPWDLNELQENVLIAVQEFKKLSDSSITNSRMKTQIIYNTFEILTDTEILISADTLIGLLIMVVIHSKVDNLEAHVYYIKNFNSTEHSGKFNYITSNLEAVLLHLADCEYLIEKSERNYTFWNAIHNKDIEVVKSMKDKELVKNINGEDCLMFAINDQQIYDLLMTNQQWISIDDILFDKNIATGQNLIMCALIEESKVLNDIVNVILGNASRKEQLMYFNSVDKSGRSVGHYLFHSHDLISKIGHLIDWELKDNNSHTPLFSLFRCYDHPQYVTLIKAGLKSAGTINFQKHLDKQGNTLLHVLLNGISETNILKQDVNINQVNFKHLTPLMHYVKYNRVENLQEILKDDRLEFMFEDTKSFYNIFDYLSFSAAKSLKSKDFEKIEKLIIEYYRDNFPNKTFALNGKYDLHKREWIITFKNDEYFEKSISSIKQIMYLTKLRHQLTIFPENVFQNMSGLTTPMFSKLRINRFIDNLNMLFQSLEFQNKSGIISFNSSLSTLESKRSISESIEHEKKDAEFTSSQIDEIQYFLEYSLTDLIRYLKLINQLNKCSGIGEIKQIDLKNLQNIVYKNELIPEIHRQYGSMSVFHEYVNWIARSGDELYKNIQKLITDIKTWKNDSTKQKVTRQLNIDIKYQHEVIASEISTFYKFRTEFLKFGLVKYVHQELRSLKQRNIELINVT